MTQCLNPDCLKLNPPDTIFCQYCGEKLVLAERYCPIKIIGQGGFGRTFQAVDKYKPSKPFCVIKQFFPQAQGTKTLSKAAELFAQEAERLDGLGRHPQIPELLAYFTQNNRQYLVQEFIDGQNLQQELEESGAFNEGQILELLKSLLPVLEFIHSNQVIHRDIKPENIIRRRNNNQFPVRASSSPGNINPVRASSSPGNINPVRASSSPDNINPVRASSSPGNINPVRASSSPGNINPVRASSSPGNINPVRASSSPDNINPNSPGNINPVRASSSPDNINPVRASSSPGNINPSSPDNINPSSSPDNINPSSSPDNIILVDFGAAKYATMTALAVTGTVIGSAGYVAPEQAVGKATFSSDIYSLGVTCIHLLTGVEPFDLFDVSESDWVWRDYLKSSVSDELGEILDKMIVGATKKRFQNVGEILSLIQPTSQPPKPNSLPQKSQTSTVDSEKGELFTFEVPTVNISGYITQRTQGSARQKIEDLGNGIKLEMVYIPGGSFLMGSPENEEGRDKNESPQHEVTLQPFYMSKYPITQQQYQAMMGNNPSKFKGENRPVEQVSWHDTIEFCKKVSRKTGKIYRLPSESQWEYACRAGTTTPFYFGETITSELVNYNGNYPYAYAPKDKYREKTTDVGSFPPNAFGLYDMHGNVLEWCQDIWHGNYNGAPNDGSAWETGGDSNRRLLRGGSWSNISRYCRCARRYNNDADVLGSSRGFRVVSSGLVVSPFGS